ncbi:MAG TPA: glycerol-3-phosphate dehydrogenase C-terminal domain-containing protein [Novosphingobium sp.]|nr:glycerol-3-phosphate dehydrogenase C-terminal domain-containing protein [Novosphingobium sp.]
MDLLAPRLGLDERGWTADAPLPGGDFAMDGAADLVARIAARYPFLPQATAARLARSYGTLAFAVLDDAASLADCGEHFGHGLTAREVRYLMAREWARTADDVLWRRSKLGLRLSASEAARLAEWMEGQCRTA